MRFYDTGFIILVTKAPIILEFLGVSGEESFVFDLRLSAALTTTPRLPPPLTHLRAT